MEGCLEETAVIAFLGGTLRPDERAIVEKHIAACSACADLVTWTAADQASGTVRLPGHEGRPFVGQLHPGARVGRYQILGAVGRGGMGEVYAAYHPDLDRRIALKVVQGAGGNEGEGRSRLLREARAIARLSHPNVVTVHDAGTFGDRVFIAMELINGATIDDWLRAEPRTWQQILDVFIAAARGLAAAHAAGIVHRDFKPQNVMIAKDGGVRVMDFGLARLAVDDATDAPVDDEATQPITIGALTKTGAVIGTPAYMAPEQFRREGVDARSDQFSFCVALHEALFGKRPAVASSGGADAAGNAPPPLRLDGVPNWLRAIVMRGASAERGQRYRSMDELVVALERGRTRVHRRVSLAAVALAALVVTAGAWRVARGNRFVCVLPHDRIATVWTASDPTNPRRQSIHRAFAASGRPTAETSWERVSTVLDDYMTAWSAMYLQTCEATHVRGEQSTEVLDLRMTCLSDNLDQARALTDALMTADGIVVSRAVIAAKDLTPMNRCADVPLLKSAVALPRDERTFREVQRLRHQLANIEATRELGRTREAFRKAIALMPEVEKVGYRPLHGEYLQALGNLQNGLHLPDAERTLEKALFVAEAARDDATAAKAAASLTYAVGVNLGRVTDAERWAELATAILDRMPTGSARTRSWVLNNLAATYATVGKLEQARILDEQAVALKEQVLGPDHPDVAISLDGLASILNDLNRPADGIKYADRAISILSKHADPNDLVLIHATLNRAEALLAIGDHDGAFAIFARSLDQLRNEPGVPSLRLAEGLSGLGRAKLALRDYRGAAEALESAKSMYDRLPGASTTRAETEFALARAVWESDGPPRRARRLAESARDTYAKLNQEQKAAIAETWLTSHARRAVSAPLPRRPDRS